MTNALYSTEIVLDSFCAYIVTIEGFEQRY